MADLYAILDWPSSFGPPATALDPGEVARGLVGARPHGPGAKVVQLRCKAADTCTRIGLVHQVAPRLRAAGVRLVVNDDVAAALACLEHVDGVHLGQDDLAALGGAAGLRELRERAPSGFTIGLSTHDLAQVRAAADLPIDHIGFGPVLPTRSKQRPEPCVGMHGLAAACEVARHPVVAIGGLDATSAIEAAERGASMVAMIGALVAPSVDAIAARVTAIAAALAGVSR